MKTIIAGRDVIINATVYTDLDNLIAANLTGAAVRVQFKFRPKDRDDKAVLTLNIGSGVTVISPTAGTVQIKLSAVQAALFTEPLIYFEVVSKLADSTYISSGVEAIEVKENLIKTLF